MGLAPIGGDAGLTRSRAMDLVSAAEKMAKAVSALNAVANNLGVQGKAVQALHQNAVDMQTVLKRAELRYRETGNALVDYSASLDASQDQANRAIALDRGVDVGAAKAQVHRLEAEGLNPFRSEDEKWEHQADLQRAAADLAEQKAQSAQAASLYQDAVADLDRAARIAMDRIQVANDSSALNDSFWDDLKSFYDKYATEFVKAVVEILDLVGDILGAVVAVLAFIPGLQGVALVIGGVAVALKVVVLIAMVIQGLAGERSWKSVMKAAIVTAASVVLKASKLKALGNVLRGKASLMDPLGVAAKVPVAKAAGDVVLFSKETSDVVRGFVYEVGGVYKADLVQFVADPEEYVVDKASDVVVNLYEEMGAFDNTWTINNAVTHDLAGPVGSDFSNVSVDDIISQAYSGPRESGPVVCREYQTVGHNVGVGGGGGGGGGGGW